MEKEFSILRMDDFLTVFGSRSEGVTKFESAQSRFDRLHISRKSVPWILCDFCGTLVNRLLYENHIVSHEFVDLAYSLCHFELAEEQQRQKTIRRIQNKEKRLQRQNHCLVGLDAEDETDDSLSSSSNSSSSSSSSSGDESSSDALSNASDDFDLSLPGCSNSVPVQPPKKRKKVPTKTVMAAEKRTEPQQNTVVNKKKRGRPTKKATKASSVPCKVGIGQQKNVEQQRLRPAQKAAKAQVVAVVDDDDGPLNEVKMDDAQTAEQNCGTVRGEEKPAPMNVKQQTATTAQKVAEVVVEQADEVQRRMIAEKQRNVREATKQRRHRDWLEAHLMRSHLGPNHHRVFVDNSAALEAYFDRRTGRVSLDNLRAPLPKLRRSRRGAASEDDLQCLL